MSVAINSTDNLLLQLLAKHLFDSNETINLEGTSLKELFEASKTQTVIAIAFDALPSEASKIDTESYIQWQALTYAVIQNSINNNHANVNLTKLLEQNGIKHCTIKGYTSASYYPEPSLRQMGDIDFLIKKEDSKRTEQLLLKNGFKFVENEHDFHVGFNKNKISYEMHTRVSRLPQDKQHLFKYLEDAVDESRRINTKCGEIIILNELHHGITMLLHMQRHMIEGSGIGLRHLADWAVFANSFENEEWVRIFENTLKKMGLWKFAKTLSKACSIYLKMPEKEWFCDADKMLSENLMYDIMQSGNFGRRETEERFQQKMFHNQKYKDRSIIARFFLSVVDNVCLWAPFYKKYKFFLPFGIVVYSVRIISQILFKKKKLNIYKLYKNGNEQYNTYVQLDLFVEIDTK